MVVTRNKILSNIHFSTQRINFTELSIAETTKNW